MPHEIHKFPTMLYVTAFEDHNDKIDYNGYPSYDGHERGDTLAVYKLVGVAEVTVPRLKALEFLVKYD